MPRVFLVASVVGLLFTLNALRPPRRPDILAVPAFFAAWLTAELPYHHLIWQVAATVAFVVAGALGRWPGWVGLGLTFVSWLGLLVLIRRSEHAADVMDAALTAALGKEPAQATASPAKLAWREILLPFPMRNPAVRVERNIPFSTIAPRPQKLDVYRPAEPRHGCPVLLFIHGGAWIIGDKREQGIPFMNHLAARGWVCVTANHRLSPRATWPDHLVDVKEALAWVRRNIGQFGGDPSFVIVSGASAGGHLAALLALTPNDARYQPGFEEVDTRVQGGVLWYGVYDLTNRVSARGRGFVRFIERAVLKAKLADSAQLFADASPMDLAVADAPPMLIIQGGNDTLVPPREAAHFAELVRSVSEDHVVYVEIPGAQHAFDVFPSVRTLHTVAGAARFCDALWARERRSRQDAPRSS